MSYPLTKSVTELAIGVDIGRTKIAVGVVNSHGVIVRSVILPAPDATDQDRVTTEVAKICCDLRSAHPNILAVGIGTAEVVNWPSGSILIDKRGGETFPLRERIEKLVGIPTIVDSDANVAAWAEARLGAGRDRKNVVLLTVGTGIGGGFVLDGKMYRGANGFAGEVGHAIVAPGGELCVCGNRGCWEAHASGTALTREARKSAALNPAGKLASLAGGADKVTGELVFAAVKQGDPIATALFAELGAWLGLGIASLILFFDPDVVIVGGGLARAGELLLRSARAKAADNVFVRAASLLPILQAQYQSEAGVVGAATLALDSRSGV